MTPVGALADGIARVRRAPAILAGMWLMTIAATLPPALVLRGMIEDHLGHSEAADQASNGVNYEWWQEFAEQASGVGATFRPTIVGFAAVLDNASRFVDARPGPVVIVAGAAAYLALWTFLAGGILDRYARDRATRAHGFFSVCGVFFFRFLRLAIIMAIVYGLLFGVVHPWLFGPAIYGRFTRDLTVERTAFLLTIGLYLVFGLALAACNLVFDYAKVRAVVEDRRSMIGAIRAAAGFIGRNASGAVALYLFDFGLFLVAVAIYALIAPGGGPSIWLALAISQIYIAARVWVKLLFWASETALFQGRLAHAGYVAAAKPVWPDSPAAEAITRL